jgi:hypothetical protein
MIVATAERGSCRVYRPKVLPQGSSILESSSRIRFDRYQFYHPPLARLLADPNYCEDFPSACDPAKTLLPSAKVTFFAFADLEPSLAE